MPAGANLPAVPQFVSSGPPQYQLVQLDVQTPSPPPYNAWQQVRWILPKEVIAPTHANVHADFPRARTCLRGSCGFTGCYASSGPSSSRSIRSAHRPPGYLVTSTFEFYRGYP